MELFDSKYVHCTWDESLKGKKVFYSDFIQCIKEEVNGHKIDARGICEAYNPDNIDNPFIIHSIKGNVHTWAYVYYDPNYEVKKAYVEGKKIQFRYESNGWIDYVFQDACWDDEGREWRVKPEEEKPEEEKPKRMTYRQLAEWLAKGNGQQSSTKCSIRFTFQEVVKADENKEVPEDYVIRRWGSDEWIEPTVDVYKADLGIN